MPLPDYSKFKAEIKRPKPSEVRRGRGCTLEKDLSSLPMADMDAEKRRSSGGMCYDMGIDLEIAHATAQPSTMDMSRLTDLGDSSVNFNDSMQRDDSSLQREGSMVSLTDPFYDEEESVTEHYDESEENQMHDSRLSIQSSQMGGNQRRRGRRDRMNKSASDASLDKKKKFPENAARKTSLHNSAPDMDAMNRSSASMDASKKSAKSLGDFLDKTAKKSRKKTNLLPGSTTEDLMGEMNEVVSMLSAKRGGTRREAAARNSAGNKSRSASRDGARSVSSTGPPLRRAGTDTGSNGRLKDYGAGSKLKDYSAPAQNGTRRKPRRASSRDSDTPNNMRRNRSHSEEDKLPSRRDRSGLPANPLRRTLSAEDKIPTRRGMPPKSKSADGSFRHLASGGTTSHTHNSFVTGSRIRRIQPGGGGGSNLGASMSSFEASCSNLSRESSFRKKQREAKLEAHREMKARGASPAPGKKNRSQSPKRKSKEKKEKKEKVKDSEVPPLLLS